MSQEPASSTSSRYAIVIHGGAGINAAKLSPEKRQRIEDSLTRILQQGKDRLAKGEAALEVVEQTIRLLEDDPLFQRWSRCRIQQRRWA